jgi:hypothetical protein
VDFTWGSIYLKWAYDKNKKTKLNLDNMDIREIQNLIKFVAKSGATEVKLEMDDFKITIKTTEAGAAEASYFQHYPAAQPMQPMMSTTCCSCSSCSG